MTQKPHGLRLNEGSADSTPIGITDITHAVDSRSKAVLAAEEFSACEIRCHMLHGQWIAETDRLVELKRQLDAIVDEITTKTVKMGPL